MRVVNVIETSHWKVLISDILPRHTSTALAAHLCAAAHRLGSTGLAYCLAHSLARSLNSLHPLSHSSSNNWLTRSRANSLAYSTNHSHIYLLIDHRVVGVRSEEGCLLRRSVGERRSSDREHWRHLRSHRHKHRQRLSRRDRSLHGPCQRHLPVQRRRLSTGQTKGQPTYSLKIFSARVLSGYLGHWIHSDVARNKCRW